MWYMPSGTNWDVLKFKAKRNVRIHGQGACGPIRSQANNTWSMNIKYRINDQDSSTCVFTSSPELRDEWECYSVSYKDIGLDPFDVAEGVEFYIFQNMASSTENQHVYG